MRASRVVTLLLIEFLTTNSFFIRTEAGHGDSPPGFATNTGPVILSYEEMIELGKPAELSEVLRTKLDALLTTPFINNEAWPGGGAPELSRSDKIGSFIRVGFWNVERGSRLDEIKLALEAPQEFKRLIKVRPDGDRYRKIIEQLEALRSVDILALNEADLGLKRTGYRDVARELAAALKMNYVYGVEFVEVDPLNLGTEQFKEISSDERRTKLRQLIEVDRGRYRGLHGTAIISRFPIRRARLVPLKYQAYDWYRSERGRAPLPEAARRQLSRLAFLEKVPREIRYGGRSVLIAELYIPQLPERALTVVATHLEGRCDPFERRVQLREVLSIIKDIEGPVVLAGDMNTSGSGMKLTSIRGEVMKLLKSTKFWLGRLGGALTPVGPAFDFMIKAAGFAQTAHDPTARSIFFFAPNKEAAFFKDLERMRFSDGHAFDFRGDAGRTVNGTKGTLANSNQRAVTKGFITTHATERTYWAVGKNKLDWIFVKAYAKDPRNRAEPYRLAPHFARTLEELNYSLGHRLSDHNPITVDLPIEEPKR